MQRKKLKTFNVKMRDVNKVLHFFRRAASDQQRQKRDNNVKMLIAIF